MKQQEFLKQFNQLIIDNFDYVMTVLYENVDASEFINFINEKSGETETKSLLFSWLAAHPDRTEFNQDELDAANVEYERSVQYE